MGITRDGRLSSTRSKSSRSMDAAVREKTEKFAPPSTRVAPSGKLRPYSALIAPLICVATARPAVLMSRYLDSVFSEAWVRISASSEDLTDAFEITSVHNKCCVREQDAEATEEHRFREEECPARAEVDALI